MPRFFLCAIISLALLLSACRQEPPPDGQAAQASSAVGKLAADFTLPNVQGEPVRLSDYRGKVVFLNFWASWCPPCREEMPDMERLNTAMEGKDFVMLAVNVEDNPAAVRSFLDANPHSFTVLLDPAAEVQKLYGVFRFPETFLIDRQGKIVQHYLGARNWASVEFMKYLQTVR